MQITVHSFYFAFAAALLSFEIVTCLRRLSILLRNASYTLGDGRYRQQTIKTEFWRRLFLGVVFICSFRHVRFSYSWFLLGGLYVFAAMFFMAFVTRSELWNEIGNLDNRIEEVAPRRIVFALVNLLEPAALLALWIVAWS